MAINTIISRIQDLSEQYHKLLDQNKQALTPGKRQKVRIELKNILGKIKSVQAKLNEALIKNIAVIEYTLDGTPCKGILVDLTEEEIRLIYKEYARVQGVDIDIKNITISQTVLQVPRNS